MEPLFDKNTNLVGWLSDDHKDIFDINLNWIAFVSNEESIWSVKNKAWIGNLYGNNIRDTNGKTVFWNPKTPLENTLRPLKPLSSLSPIRPLTPLKPINPLRPLKPLPPLGGWSLLTWNEFVNL